MEILLLLISLVAVISAAVTNQSPVDAVTKNYADIPPEHGVKAPLINHCTADETYFQVQIPTGAPVHLLHHSVILPYEYCSSSPTSFNDMAKVYYRPTAGLSMSSTHNLLPHSTFVDTCEYDNNCKAFFVIGSIVNAMVQLLQVLIESNLWLSNNFSLVKHTFVDPRSGTIHFVIPQSLVSIYDIDYGYSSLRQKLDLYITSVLLRPKWSIEADDWQILLKALREGSFSDHEAFLVSVTSAMSYIASIPEYDKMFASYVLDAPLVINQRDVFFDAQHLMPSIDRNSSIVMAQVTRTPMNLDGTPVSATLKKGDMCLVAYSHDLIDGSIFLEDNLKGLYFSVISEVEYAPFIQSAYYVLCAQSNVLGTLSYAVVFEFNTGTYPTLLSECHVGYLHPKWREIIMAVASDCMELYERFEFLHGRINADMIIRTRFDNDEEEKDDLDDQSPIYQWRPFAIGMAPFVQERSLTNHNTSCAWIAPERLGTILEMTAPHTEAMDVWAFGILILQLTGAKYEIVEADETGSSAPLSADFSSSSAGSIFSIVWLGHNKYLRYSMSVPKDDAIYLDGLLTSILTTDPSVRLKWDDVFSSQLFQVWSRTITPESCNSVMSPMIEHCNGRVVGWNPRRFLSFGRQIGVGGQGSVQKAIYRLSRKEVALKFMTLPHSSRNPVSLDGIAQPEIEFWLAQPKHPNIASLLASFTFVHLQGSNTPQLFVCTMMELATCDINRLIISSHRTLKRDITDRECAFITRSVCLALEHLHSLGVIHCDVKTSNLLFYANPADPSISDLLMHRFALADLDGSFIIDRSIRHSRLQRYKVPNRTTKYVRAPEQFRHEMHSDGVDIWATGVMLGELLSRCVYHSFDYEYVHRLCSTITSHSEAISRIAISRHYANRHRPLGTESLAHRSDMINTFLHMATKLDPNARCSATELLEFPLMKLLDVPLLSNEVENFMYNTIIFHRWYMDVPGRVYQIDAVTGLPIHRELVHVASEEEEKQLFKQRLVAVMFSIKSKHSVKFLRAHVDLSKGHLTPPVMMIVQYHTPDLLDLMSNPLLITFNLLVQTAVALVDLLINLSNCQIIHGRIKLGNMFLQQNGDGMMVVIGLMDMLPGISDEISLTINRDRFDAAAALRELNRVLSLSNPPTEQLDLLKEFISNLENANVALDVLKNHELVIHDFS